MLQVSILLIRLLRHVFYARHSSMKYRSCLRRSMPISISRLTLQIAPLSVSGWREKFLRSENSRTQTRGCLQQHRHCFATRARSCSHLPALEVQIATKSSRLVSKLVTEYIHRLRVRLRRRVRRRFYSGSPGS